MGTLLLLAMLALSGCATIAGHPAPVCPAGRHAVQRVPGDTLTGIGGTYTPDGVYRQGYKCIAE